MAVSQNCIDAVKAASGDAVSDAEAGEILQAVEALRARLEAEGRIADAEALLRQGATRLAERARAEAALRKSHVALMALKRIQAEAHIDRYLAVRPGGFAAALMSLLDGAEPAFEGARTSVAATRVAFQNRYHGSLLAQIQRERPHLARLLGDRDLNARVAIEMGELRAGGTPGIAKDADAQWLAKLFADIIEIARRDLNERGADIGELDGWRPQIHDPFRLLKVTPERWAAQIGPLLDLERSFPDAAPEAVPAILRALYATLASGRDREAGAAGDASGKRSRQRLLHFRDTQAWLTYNEGYGIGTISTAVMAHLERVARLAAQMEVLGPDPKATFHRLAETLRQRAGSASGAGAELDPARIRRLSALEDWPAWRVMTGAAAMPLDPTPAQLAAEERSRQALAKLGEALVSTTAETVALVDTLRVRGKPLLGTWAAILGGRLAGRGDAEARHLALLHGEGYDALIGAQIARFATTDTRPGWIAKGVANAFKWSGATGFTDIARSVALRIGAADLGYHAKFAWAALPVRYRRTLAQRGISEAKWEVLRQATWRAEETGRVYLTPDRLQDLDDAVLDSDLAADAPSGSSLAERSRRRRELRDGLEMDLRRFMVAEAGFSAIQTDGAWRLIAGAPGTPAGAATRTILRFEGFPAALAQRAAGRSLQGDRESGPRDFHIAEALAGLLVAGAMAQQAKEIAAGLAPPAPTETSGAADRESLAAAFTLSGVAGIYGDLLFAEASRFGLGVEGGQAGPALGEVGAAPDLLRAAKAGDRAAGQALAQGLRDTPYANLFYLRPALDALLLDALREAAAPGEVRRQRRRLQADLEPRLFPARSA
ncbi:MAG: hypothetical protein Kilf2KO_49100 [Rhodospirillales bacterium]